MKREGGREKREGEEGGRRGRGGGGGPDIHRASTSD